MSGQNPVCQDPKHGPTTCRCPACPLCSCFIFCPPLQMSDADFSRKASGIPGAHVSGSVAAALSKQGAVRGFMVTHSPA